MVIRPDRAAPVCVLAVAALLGLAVGSAGATTTSTGAAATLPQASETAPAETPQTWSEEEIAAARASCGQTLAGLDVTFEQAEPIRESACGTPAPIRLSRAAGVEIRPPAVVNCAVAAALARWLGQSVQPGARQLLGKPVRRLANVSAYVCRGRNGISGAPLSEHAYANAIDIAAFELEGGGTVTLARHWGPTSRDLVARSSGDGEGDGGSASGAVAAGNNGRGAPGGNRRVAQATVDRGAPGRGGSATGSRPLASPTSARLGPVTPDQAVDVARLELRIAEARLAVVERQRALLGLAAREGEVRARRAALAELSPEAYASERSLAGERRRGGRSRSQSNPLQGSASQPAPAGLAIPPAPKQNPGTGALDRARRQAERNLARIEAEQRRLEAIEAARARAEAAKARDLARIDAELRRAERQTSEAREQLGRAEERYDEAIAALASYIEREGLIVAPEPAPAAAPAGQNGGSERGTTPQLPQRRPQAGRAPASRSPSRSAVEAPTPVTRTAEARFLRALHKEACGIFTTVLGPEANEAHRDHFHLDMAARRRNAFCE